MSRVSILEVEEDRRNDAAHLGVLPPATLARGLKVRTGLETTQDINTEPPPPLSDSQRRDLLRRAVEKENNRTYLRNTLQSPFFKIAPVHIPDQNAIDRTHETRRVVLVVERVIQNTLSGKSEVWLKIYQRNDKRFSYRLPKFSDQSALRSKYPFYFFLWSDVPSSIDCLGEWVDGEWKLLDVFDPYA